MFGLSDAHAHRRPRSGILIALLATCLAIVGSGGTTAVHHPAAGDMPAATSTAAPAPSSSNAAAASSQQPSSRSAIGDRQQVLGELERQARGGDAVLSRTRRKDPDRGKVGVVPAVSDRQHGRQRMPDQGRSVIRARPLLTAAALLGSAPGLRLRDRLKT
jgi:hypothetical protein